ncbi:MAG TPA: hypothetical protein VKT51_02835 [Candidatus Eremiobacteraceae bacterium]|nr:hypothetical protein [Candidatus Eremiobacteraceae bacterium]
MNVVIVGGPHSGVGKTLAAERALQALAGLRYGAIKLTVADGEFDKPHDRGVCGRGASCGVCETVSTALPARIVTAPGAINKPNTDTRRLANAGAIAVAWVIALREQAPAALAAALDWLNEKGAHAAVIEGTTAIEWLRPSASVLVATDPGKRWKRVAVEHLDRFDIILHNLIEGLRGDVSPPPAFQAAAPIRCDLADTENEGTRDYQRALRARCAADDGVLTAKRGASPRA